MTDGAVTYADLYAFTERQYGLDVRRKWAEAMRDLEHEWLYGPIVKRVTVKPGGLFGTPEIGTQQRQARMNAIIRRVA